MTTLTLKNQIFGLVDKIEDATMLQEINHILVDYIQHYLENPLHELQESEKNKIQIGLDQLNANQEIPHTEIQKNILEWRKK